MRKETPLSHHRNHPLRHALKRAAVAGVTTSLLLTGAAVTTAQTASAAPAQGAAPAAATVAVTAKKPAKKAVKRAILNRKKVLAAAARLKGRPYRYGASGPKAFDCSGYTQYVMKTQKRKIPRTSRSQYAKAKKVSRGSARPGDLVFYRSGSGRVYHVGIYAGKGRLWHSPHSGSSVRLAKISNKRWVAGRI